MWRSAAALVGVLTALTVIEAFVSPPDRFSAVVWSGVASAVFAVIAWFFGPRFPPRTSFNMGRLFLVLGVLTVAGSMYNWRGTSVTNAMAFHYVIVMIFATAFFGRREIYEVFALVTITSAAVLSIDGKTGQNLFVWLTILIDLAGVSFVMTRAVERMRALSYDDPLTGALNRRWWQVALASEVTEHKRTHAPLSLVLIDIDHFKAVNDTKGHEGGDQLLRDAVTAFRSRTRSMDQFARLGGDEFAVLLPGCDAPAALAFATTLLAALILETGVSCSIGVATLSATTESEDPEQLFSAADRYLYLAKSRGRAQVVSVLNEHVSPFAEATTNAGNADNLLAESTNRMRVSVPATSS
jgi:diguanylate cyclase (GGDEF)-like protein